MSRKFRPTAECLEDRLVLNGKMGENIEPLTLLTTRAGQAYSVAYYNQQALQNLYNSVQASLAQFQASGNFLSDIQANIDKANEIVANEKSTANTMNLYRLAEKVIKKDYGKHAPVHDALFQTYSHDFQIEDDWINNVAVPFLNSAEAQVQSQLQSNP